jgi:hypothetical protein
VSNIDRYQLGIDVQVRHVDPWLASGLSFVSLFQIRRQHIFDPFHECADSARQIVDSSGQPKLDAAALKTIRDSAPFAPPPKELTISIAVDFARKT